jgi:Domain of unknown function (DUF932)
VARLTNLDDVIFPVAEHPIFASIDDPADEIRISVPDKKAIVDRASNRVLGIVGRAYRLVTNREALDWAFQCCEEVFQETNSSEWEVKYVDAPSTATYCRIDLVHNLATLNFEGALDVFGPFIRVTNSYNGLRALAFDIGFARKICTNGVIFPEQVIKFTFIHSRREIQEKIHFQVAREELAELKVNFQNYVATLRDCPIPREDFERFVCGVLGVHRPDPFELHTRDADDWSALIKHIGDLCTHYAAELGENAYSVFNAVTEFASHPPTNRLINRERHTLQRTAGEWVSSFTNQVRKSAFDLTAYLSSLTAPTTEPVS